MHSRSQIQAKPSDHPGAPAFEPALALYCQRGFINGEPFGNYAQSEFNQFLRLDLRVSVSVSPSGASLGRCLATAPDP
jgi:hypothetical protein